MNSSPSRAEKVGSSIASAYSDCGALRACDGPLRANPSVAGPRVAGSCSGPSARITSGPWDLQFDETADHRRLKLLNIVDEHTREALAMRGGRTCDADHVVAVIEALVATRGIPGHLRMDDGAELIAWALRDWCRLAGTTTTYIEPGSPWENPFIESFNGRVRDDLLNIEEFGSLLEAQVVAEAWRTEYNTYRPHSSLDRLTLADYAKKWTINQHSHSSWTS
jgi:putative transposase